MSVSRARVPRSRHLPLLVLLLPALAAGCATTRLRPQLEKLQEFTQVSGRIVGADEGERCLAVLVDDSASAPRIVNYAFANAAGDFVLLGQTGKLRVLAFADRNRDASLDDDEPVGWATVPSTPGGGPTARLQVGEVALSTASPRPGFAVDLSWLGRASGPARARRFGEIVALDDPRFEPEVVARGVWEPLRFAEESGLRILFTEPYDPMRVPVVFVHGMQGSPRDFRALVASLDRSRFQAWLYYYPTGLDLDVNALVLRELLAELRQRLDFERVEVVAHSMGGLVSFAALTGAEDGGVELGVDRFVTISTPWLGALGTRGMKVGLKLAPTVAPSWTEMLPESGFLERLEAREIPAGVHFSLLFGYGGSNAMVAGGDDGTVAVRSMVPWNMVRQAEHVLPIDADHEGILEDPDVLAAVALLLRGEPPTPVAASR
jgi:pimeloyl-ACP methyl ester carboxylesterase